MIEQAPDSLERSSPDSSVYAANLLRFYSFDLGERTIADLLIQWQGSYPENWVRLALIEALYQGRYKAISVEQILAFWHRRGQPLHRFNHDFERLVCNKLPRNLAPTANVDRELFSALPDRSRPSNIVNFPTSLSRADPPLAIEPAEPPPPEAPQPGSFPSARLREVLAADSELAAPGQDTPSIVPLSSSKPEPSPIEPLAESERRSTLRPAATVPGPRAPQPIKKATPLAIPDFGLTPPHLSLKLRLQLAALYQPNWIVPAASDRPFHQFVLSRRLTQADSQGPSLRPSNQGQPKAEATPAAIASDNRPYSIEDDLDDLKSDLW